MVVKKNRGKETDCFEKKNLTGKVWTRTNERSSKFSIRILYEKK